jgi:hypothetical protein
MTQKEQRGSAKQTLPNAGELAETMGKKQVEAMVDMQKELIQATEELNREWVERLKAEAELATEFAGKVTAAKSIPETAAICQEWMQRRMEMFAADMQKLTTLTARLLPRGWPGGSS